MCGIVGLLQKNNQPISSQLLTRMRDVLAFRGPDNAGIWTNKNVGFGHRRLSIIDISALGHQPMVDEETGSVIVHNGEIYNYQQIRKELEKDNIYFKSKTDTEVILKAYRKWGIACIERFNGMFAFAIWDAQQNGLFIARDRLGIKPLYYYNNNNIFIFSSRLSPLMIHPECPGDIDSEALGIYLEMGFIPAPWSILKGVKKLKPGNTLWIDKKGCIETCYWSLDNISVDNSLNNISENELIDRLDNLLNESVKSHLISDVPLGVFLSGGIDSSLIAALMGRHSQYPPKTFTIGFEEKRFDESGYAQKIAKHLGADHNVRIMKSDDLLLLLNDITHYYDEPFADPSSLPTVMLSRFAREQVKVCLSGDGGDELFAGYSYYAMLLFLKHFYATHHWSRLFLRKLTAITNNSKLTLLGETALHKDILDNYFFMRSIIRQHNRQSLLQEEVISMKDLYRKKSANFPALDDISKLCRLDISYYLPDDILQKVDVASMSIGLEARVPMLDHKVAEFSQSLPIEYKIRQRKGKWILKKVLSKYIPVHLFDKPKRVFTVPLRKWFREELKEIIQDELSLSRIRRFGYINSDRVQELVNWHISRKHDTQQILWAILCLLRWDIYRKELNKSLK